MHKYVTAAAALASMILSSACGATKSPTAPSTTTTPLAGAAMISGSVRSGSPLLAASTGAATSPLTVTVVGTTISSGVDVSDRFTLMNVAPGDVELRFSGAGVDSTVRLSLVLPSQTVALVVNVPARRYSSSRRSGAAP